MPLIQSCSITTSWCPGRAPSRGRRCQVSLLSTDHYYSGINVCLLIDWFVTFCSFSAFPLPIYIWVSILPDRHLDPATNVPSGPVCASCFHGYFLTCSLLFLLLGEYFWSTCFLLLLQLKGLLSFSPIETMRGGPVCAGNNLVLILAMVTSM